MLANSFIGIKINFKYMLKMSLVFAIICYIIKNIFYGGIDTVLIIFAVAVIYYIFSKSNLINSFILIAISYGIKFVSEFLIIGIGNYIGISFPEILDNNILKTIFFYMTLIIPIIIIKHNSNKNFKLLNKPVKKNIKIHKNKLFMYILVMIGAVNIIIVSGIVVISKLNNYRTYESYEIALILIIMTSVISLIIMALNLDKSKDTALIEKNLMAINLQQMEETVDLLRIQKHDMMNHLQVILMQINNNHTENAKKYILGLAEEVNNVGMVFDTGNNYIDAILNFKNRKCTDFQIVLTACIDSLLEDTTLEDTQLSSVFLNIIDNAIDELKNTKQEYKYIHVDTFYDDDKHIISIKNNGPRIKDTDKIFEMGVSSKGESRGYGLYSIRQLLSKHKSKIYVVSDSEETEFIIEIPRYISVLDKVSNI